MKIRASRSFEFPVGQGARLQEVLLGAFSQAIYGDPRLGSIKVEISRLSIYTMRYSVVAMIELRGTDAENAEQIADLRKEGMWVDILPEVDVTPKEEA